MDQDATIEAGREDRRATRGRLVRAKGLGVVPTGDSQADRVINGKRTEIKFSTLWTGGDYVFQQIRDQNYDQLVLLGLSPFTVKCWVVPKAIVMGTVRDGLRGQHGGGAATETAWLRFRAAAPPAWLSAYGGTLVQALDLLAR